MSHLREIESEYKPRILIIDDQYGRSLRNEQSNDLRHSWRMTHGLVDVTGDASATSNKPKGQIIARAVFHSGQTPASVGIGDTIQNDLEAAVEAVRKGWECNPKDRWACVLVDLEFVTGVVSEASSQDEAGGPTQDVQSRSPADYFGLELIDAIKTKFPDLPVVILSSNKKDQAAISERYEGQGVKVFIDKQCSREELQNYIWDEGLVPDEMNLSLGYSLPLLKALRLARKAARTRSPVLITGESGTGKQPLAEYLMQWSAKLTNGPQLEFNCANLERETGGSQLFGHIRGAFTGATSDKIGLIEAADRGDLFLDELHRLRKDGQAKLLKVVENGRLTRLGEDEAKYKKVDVRIIGGSNADLDGLVKQGEFLHDLFYRLSVFTIELPPLTQRFEDLELIVTELIQRLDKQEHPRKIGTGLLQHLMTYTWPGNIRELSKKIEHACGLNREAQHLLPRDIPLPAPPQSLPQADPGQERVAPKNGQPPNLGRETPADQAKLGPEMSVAEFLDFLENVQFTVETDEELRGVFSSGKEILGKYEKASNTAITRLVLLALDKCVAEADAREMNYNFSKTIQLLVDAAVRTTKFNRFVQTHCLSLEGPVGDQFRKAWEKKKSETKPRKKTTT